MLRVARWAAVMSVPMLLIVDGRTFALNKSHGVSVAGMLRLSSNYGVVIITNEGLVATHNKEIPCESEHNV